MPSFSLFRPDEKFFYCSISHIRTVRINGIVYGDRDQYTELINKYQPLG